MQTTNDERLLELAAVYAKSKDTVRDEIARRRAVVEEMLTLVPRAEVAQILGISTQRVSEIVGGVRG